MSATVAERARAGCLRFFVFSLSVNDRRGRLARVLAHSFPDAHYVPARGIHNLTAAVLDLLLDGSHHVGCTQIDFFPSCRAAGNKVRAHILVVILSAAWSSRRYFAPLNMTR